MFIHSISSLGGLQYSHDSPPTISHMSMTPAGMPTNPMVGASGARKTGRVKFFNSQKGFGFVIPDDKATFGNAEVFVHHTAIHNDGGFKSLAEGEDVEFDMVKGPKGFQAANVTGPAGASVKGDPNAGRAHPNNPNNGSHGGQMTSSPQLNFNAFGGLPMTGYGMPGQTAAFGIPFGQSPPFGNAAMFPGAFGQGQFPAVFSGLPAGNFQMQPAAAFGNSSQFPTSLSNGSAATFATANMQNPTGFVVQPGQTAPQSSLAGQDPLTGLTQTDFDLTPHFQGTADQQFRRPSQQ
ncbi:cold-shock' DNA-binding domain-containing protein [Syncephalis plumigaleata]|nr:cold-shock' DNA-binding domain-containing protein [Syncephalis plumigaleata]